MHFIGPGGAMLATASDLLCDDLDNDIKATNLLSYTANLVVGARAGTFCCSLRHGGIGGLTML